MRVGFIGLGSQGGPMARRIVDARTSHHAVGPSPASLEPYRRHRGQDRRPRPPNSPPHSDLVCLCVVGDDDVTKSPTATTACWPGWHPGSIIAVHSTVHPDTCRELAETAAAKGVSVIDAPVSGGGPAVEGGTPAGDGRRRRRPTSSRCARCSRPTPTRSSTSARSGAGQVAKILNNLLFTANLGQRDERAGTRRIAGDVAARSCARSSPAGSANSMALAASRAFGGIAGQPRPDRRRDCCRRTSGTPRPRRQAPAPKARCSTPPTPRWR